MESEVFEFCSLATNSGIVTQVEDMLDGYSVSLSTVIGEVGYIDFLNSGEIIAVLDIPEIPIFLVWSICPNRREYKNTIEKILEAITDDGFVVSNRIANCPVG
jgi:hypothetical protein